MSRFISHFTCLISRTAALFMLSPICVFADNDEITLEQGAVELKKIIFIICGIIGVIYLLVGVIKFAIANADTDEAGMKKAIMMLATGIAMIALVSLFKSLNF